MPRTPEFLYLRQFVVEERPDEAVEFAGAAHVHAHRLAAVLEEDGGLRVLEDDVVARVAPVELALYLGVEVVVRVLRLPVAARQAERILHRAVRPNAGGQREFRHEHHALAVLAAVGVEAVRERGADALLVGGAAELDELLQVLVVALDVGVIRHGVTIPMNRGWDRDVGLAPSRERRGRPSAPPPRVRSAVAHAGFQPSLE